MSDRVYVIKKGSISGGRNSKSILSDESLLALADMKPPIVLQTLSLLRLRFHGDPLTVKDLARATDVGSYDYQRPNPD